MESWALNNEIFPQMANPISNLTAAVASLRNENSLSLANLNFDFKGLGMTISPQRKKDGEEGSLHRTARRLGALFDGCLPQTPTLFRAYGTRVSEISSQSSVNPRGTQGRDGIFANQIGADATSIWAAVTSGPVAIAVHLLACMLARIFTGPEATAIWVELVETQKEHLRKRSEEDMYFNPQDAARWAAQQEIPRKDLAEWDASARAWIQSADQAKALQHKQIMLILNNTPLPVNNEPKTYESVLTAWKGALEAMNNLVQGIPQRIHDGAALLGISAWHMYPDMIVYNAKPVEVKQNDPLFKEAAPLTLGLEPVGKKGVSWSLPLARLQYYGEPVYTTRSVSPDNTRITATEFSYVVLGCLFSGWKDFARTANVGLKWLNTILVLLGDYERPITGVDMERHWLEYLKDAAQSLLNCAGIEKRIARQLFQLGTRRAKFLHDIYSSPSPLFGLTNLSVLLGILNSDDARLDCLRNISARLDHTTDIFIRFQPSGNKFRFEYTALNLADPDTGFPRTYWLEVTELELLGDFKANDLQRNIDEVLRDKRKKYLPVLKLASAEKLNYQLVFGTGMDFYAAATSLKRTLTQTQRTSMTGDVMLRMIAGDPEIAAIFSTQRTPHRIRNNVDAACMEELVNLDRIDPGRLKNYLFQSLRTVYNNRSARNTAIINSAKREVRVLKACAAISEIYKDLPGATISTLILEQSLYSASWIPDHDDYDNGNSSSIAKLSILQGANKHELSLRRDGYGMTLSDTLACICMMDSGYRLSPDWFKDVFALSTGNSIFVARTLVCDPFEDAGPKVQRVTGNIGRAGISLLLAPPAPKIAKRTDQNWRVINHNHFEGSPQDCFTNTSIHLSFTDYEFALMPERNAQHIIDRPINQLETLVSVFDGPKWVADLDILHAINDISVGCKGYRGCCIPSYLRSDAQAQACDKQPKHTYEEASAMTQHLNIIAIDNWDELLDPPKDKVMVVRAHQNWVARLALMAVCWKLKYRTIIAPEKPCWPCSLHLIKKNPVFRRIGRDGSSAAMISTNSYSKSSFPIIGSSY
jgi:hypothetical protein